MTSFDIDAMISDVVGDSDTHASDNIDFEEVISEFCDDLYSRLVTHLEVRINGVLTKLANCRIKELSKDAKDALAHMTSKGATADRIIEKCIAKVEMEIEEDIVQAKLVTSRHAVISQLMPNNMSPDEMFSNINGVRAAIQQQLRVHQEIKRRENIVIFEESYKRKFAESLPSIKMPANHPLTSKQKFEDEIMKLTSEKTASGYYDGELTIDNYDNFMAKLKHEKDKLRDLKDLYIELKYTAQKNQASLSSLENALFSQEI